jgi:hypothetical protein
LSAYATKKCVSLVLACPRNKEGIRRVSVKDATGCRIARAAGKHVLVLKSAFWKPGGDIDKPRTDVLTPPWREVDNQHTAVERVFADNPWAQPRAPTPSPQPSTEATKHSTQ